MTMQRTLSQIISAGGDLPWRFDTPRYTVAFWAEPEDCAPEDHFEFDDDIAFASDGEPAHWFCAFVGVFERTEDDDGKLLGYDCLGGCSYNSFEEFVSLHRQGPGSYFPEMVRQAITEARRAA